MGKKILIVVLILGLIGAAIGLYLWNKPHKMVENARGVAISAVQLAKDYTANEQTANAKYLNKALEVSGTVSEIDKNQDGGLMVILDSGDPMTGVQCTMREKGVNVAKGQQLTVKGFCSGSGITGVSLTDCIIK
jgi:precorrin-6B methylase 1